MTASSLRICVRRAAGDDLAEVEHHDLVADAQHEAHVVVDEQDGHALARAARAGARRARRSRRCPGRRRARPSAPAAGAGRARGRRRRACGGRGESSVGRRSATSVEPAQLERPVDVVARVLADRQQQVAQRLQHAHALAGDEQVLLDREVVEQLDALPRAHEAAARALVRAQARDVLAVEGDACRCDGRVVAGERVDRRRLAGAVGADQADDRARRDRRGRRRRRRSRRRR